MRALGLVLAVLACGAALFVGLSRAPEEARGARTDPPAAAPATEPAAEDDGRIAALERRVDELDFALGALQSELARAGESRSPATVAPRAEPRPAADSSGERPASWYLEQYVASFSGGGEGSEYFRLAVEAFAPSLLTEIGAWVLDARANPLLRLRLVQMLGDARFRGNGAALDVCLRCLASRAAEAVVEAALGALKRVGDPGTARALEACLWSLESNANRRKALQTLVALAGEGANAALARLWPGALDDAERAFLIGQVAPIEGQSSLALFERASLAAQSVRLQAALAVGKFAFDAFAPFLDGWIARETDPAVREALGASRKKLTEPASWSAARATGPPNAQSLEDDPNAWASAKADMGLQWLELTYEPALVASSVRVFEVCVAGAIASVVALDERGNRQDLWTGVDPTRTPGVFELQFPPTPFRVRTLRLTLDTDRREGWSEIDAVELIGPQGRAWASAARASSSYGG